MRRNPLRDMVVNHPGLNGNALIRNIHIEDSGHAGKADDDSTRSRQRATREPCTCASRYERNPMPRTNLNDRLNFGCRARQYHRSRNRTQRRKAIALIGMELILSHNNAIRSNCGCKLSEDNG